MQMLKKMQFGMSEQWFDPAQMNQMKADTINGTAGDRKGYDCPTCKNRGFIAFVSEAGTLMTRDCSCMQVRKCLRQGSRSGLQAMLLEKRFENFQIHQPWQKKMLELCQDYAAHPEGWLLLCGQSGSGKTHMCAAVCNRLLDQGYPVRYMSWRESAVQLKSLSGDYEQQQQLLDTYKKAKVLYIDDLFKCGGRPTAADISLAFELMNYRYNGKLPTIVSTELLPTQLVELDEAIGSRMVELAGKNLVSIPKDIKRNYRRQKNP